MYRCFETTHRRNFIIRSKRIILQRVSSRVSSGPASRRVRNIPERERERDVDRGIDVRFTDDINKTETKGGILHREIPARSIIVALAENHMSRSSTWMSRASIYDRRSVIMH